MGYLRGSDCRWSPLEWTHDRRHRDADTPAGVLAAVRSASAAAADAAEARQLQAAVAWAAMHSADSLADAATVWDRDYGDTGIPVAGPGAPLVAEFSVAEFAAAVGLLHRRRAGVPG